MYVNKQPIILPYCFNMSFKSVNTILGILQVKAKWQEPPLVRLTKSWEEVVGAVVAKNTKPVDLQRNTLWVATKSAAWSQNLSFERQHLLTKINAVLPYPIDDIRFSTAHWYRPPEVINKDSPSLEEHPCYFAVGELPRDEKEEEEDNLNNHLNNHLNNSSDSTNSSQRAFVNWSHQIKQRSLDFPLCPNCQCSTPPKELEHWGVCHLCAAKTMK
jgi:predicted nucleic acid-binding Zn ribbon protein